ncbi:hypothetical protein ACFL7M_01180 [Thermodesulfobacteriota bacterium]
MSRKQIKNIFMSNYLWIILLIAINTGCQFQRGRVSQIRPLPLQTGKIVILGFSPAMPQGAATGVIRSPFSGAVFMAEPIPQDVADKMSANLFGKLLEYKGYELIGPNQASGVFAHLVTSDQGISDIKIFQRIGQAFSADAVMTGYIYRWREREGTDYSVNRPASVAFDIYLVRSKDGAVLWKSRFDKTQKSLSENILDMGTFLKGKARWMTVDGLAELGLAELLDNSLLAGKENKDNKD